MIQKGVCLVLFFCLCFVLIIKLKENKNVENKNRIVETQKIPKSLEGEEYLFEYKNYKEIIDVLKKWEGLAPDLIDTGYYGKTNKGTDTFFIKVSNEFNPGKEVVLLTACIHGNEPWSTSTMLGYVGKLLSSYGKDERITKILNEKTIYFIPVVSPDTYGNSRRVDGVDPNRDFPTLKNPDKKSVPPVQNLRDFFLEIKPRSVLSGHTYGRVFLVPWGDTRDENPNEEDYKRIASKMASLANYKWMKASQLYGTPIIGAEDDWYHRNGAFAMVMEFGTHQKHPSLEDTKTEFHRTLESVLFFIEESVKINIKQQERDHGCLQAGGSRRDEAGKRPSQKDIIQLNFINVPKKNLELDDSSIYNDIISRQSKPFGDNNGRHINVHETAHGIHSDLRNQYSKSLGYRVNAFYCLKGKAILLKEPSLRIRDIQKYIPDSLRSYRYQLYFVEQLSGWDDMPTYILEEWVAYILGSECAVDDHEKNIKTPKSDAVSGCLDFSIYAIATAKAIKEIDPKYWEENPEFKEFIKYNLKRAEKTFKAGRYVFKSSSQEKLLESFLNDENSNELKNFMQNEFGDYFLNIN